MEQWIIWLLLTIILGLIELFTIKLTTIWFVISGLLAMIVSIYVNNYAIQFAIFAVVGVVLLLTTKPAMVKFLKERKEKNNMNLINKWGLFMHDNI